MCKERCPEWDILKKNFVIVFEHYTEVPGLADSLKQIDGFLFASDQCSALFYRKPFKNARSAVGSLDPGEETGFTAALSNLSADASKALQDGRAFQCSVDFNFAVSGDSDSHRGGAKIKKVEIAELIGNLKTGILQALSIKLNPHAGGADSLGQQLDVSRMVNDLSDRGVSVIHLQFAVRHMPIINYFGGRSERLRDAIKASTKEYPHKSGDGGKRNLTIMAHFRRGDISIFPLADGRFLSCWGRPQPSAAMAFSPEIINSPKEAVYTVHDFSPYLDLIRESTAGYEAVKIVVASDGFSRGLERAAGAAETLGISADEVSEMRNWAKSEEKRFLELLNDFCVGRNYKFDFIFGETEQLFKETVSALANADILLFTSGGFSRTLFKYLNKREGAIMMGPLSSSNRDYVIMKIREYLSSASRENSPCSSRQ